MPQGPKVDSREVSPWFRDAPSAPGRRAGALDGIFLAMAPGPWLSQTSRATQVVPHRCSDCLGGLLQLGQLLQIGTFYFRATCYSTSGAKFYRTVAPERNFLVAAEPHQQ